MYQAQIGITLTMLHFREEGNPHHHLHLQAGAVEIYCDNIEMWCLLQIHSLLAIVEC